MIKVALLTTDSREHFKDYATPTPYFGTAPEALLEGFKLLPEEVEVHVVSCLQRMPASSPIKLAENIHYHALHVPSIGWMKTGYQGCIRAVSRKLREIQPDVVHGQGTERDCAISAVFSGFPNVLTIHGVMRSISRVTGSRPLSYYWLAKHLETVALSRTCGVVAISPYVNEIVAPLTRRTWSIPNALRLPFFKPSQAIPRQPGPARLINVGVIGPNKRQLELLQALARLREKTPFSATFLGKADLTATYTHRFATLLHALNDRHGGFIHHNHFTAEQLVDTYDDADALVHFSGEESFGLIFAEALARNLALFVTDVGAVRQIAEGKTNCQIFAAGNIEGFISALGNWVAERGYSWPRCIAPDSAIKSRYHPRAVATNHLAVYRAVVNGR